jgi:MFS family permease
VFLVPRLTARFGYARLLAGGVTLALAGMAWLSQISVTTPYATGIALPMAVLGLGAGLSLAPLTAVGIAGVAPEDAGAASGLVNVAQQLGGSLGLGILVTVFAAADPSVADAGAALTERIAASLTVGAIMLAAALVVVLVLIVRPRRAPATVIQLAQSSSEAVDEAA